MGEACVRGYGCYDKRFSSVRAGTIRMIFARTLGRSLTAWQAVQDYPAADLTGCLYHWPRQHGDQRQGLRTHTPV